MRAPILAALLAAPLFGSAAAAQAQWYFGGNLGWSDPNRSGLDGDAGFEVYGGYHFNPGISGQVGYANLGDFDRRRGGSVEVTGVQAALLGRIGINERVAIVGKAGLFGWDNDVSGAPGGGDDGVDGSFGFGVQYALPNDVGVRGQWERFLDVGDTDINYFSVGVTFGY